jgi:hypothetical protein
MMLLVKRSGNRSAGITGGCDKDHDILASDIIGSFHEAGQKARTEILERCCRPMKELKYSLLMLKLMEFYGKIKSLITYTRNCMLKGVPIEKRSKYPMGNLTVSEFRIERLRIKFRELLRDIQPPVRCKPVKDCLKG